MLKILIVTAAFNAEKTIQETLESTKILCNKNLNIIHVVKDALSNDKTVEITKQYQHVKLVSSKDNGIYDGFNQGASFTDWDFIYYLNADDVLTMQGSVSLDWLSKFGDKNKVYCFSIEIIRLNKQRVLYDSKKINLLKVISGYMPPHPGMIVGKNLFVKFDTNFKVSADYNFFLEIWHKNKGAFNNFSEIIAEMKEGGNSQTTRGRLISFYEDSLSLSKFYGRFFGYLISLLKKIRGVIKWYLI